VRAVRRLEGERREITVKYQTWIRRYSKFV